LAAQVAYLALQLLPRLLQFALQALLAGSCLGLQCRQGAVARSNLALLRL
jgi:hypothetical protein